MGAFTIATLLIGVIILSIGVFGEINKLSKEERNLTVFEYIDLKVRKKYEGNDQLNTYEAMPLEVKRYRILETYKDIKKFVLYFSIFTVLWGMWIAGFFLSVSAKIDSSGAKIIFLLASLVAVIEMLVSIKHSISVFPELDSPVNPSLNVIKLIRVLDLIQLIALLYAGYVLIF